MDMLDQDIDGRMETNSASAEENPNSGRWEVVEVIQDLNSARTLHNEMICPDGLSAQEEKVNVDDPPPISDSSYSNAGGTVTYRVVQVTPDLPTDEIPATQIVTTSTALVSGQQVAQAIIANPFTANGGGSPSADGPFYVMMSPQDVLQTGQRALAPRTHQFSPKHEGARTARDERRRATHNEVERRRRDKINNWIMKLSKIVPDCTSEHTKQGQQFYSQSKGGILAKTCDYIQELRAASARVPEIATENKRMTMDMEVLRQQCEKLKGENQLLRALLQQNGISVATVENNS